VPVRGRAPLSSVLPVTAWKAPARSLRRASTVVDKVASQVELARLIRTRDPILIYSMGKAGTSAMTASVKAVTGRPVVKVHAISRSGVEQRRLSSGGGRPRILWAGNHLRREFRLDPRHRWTVICGVREPIARGVSAYFYRPRPATTVRTHGDRDVDASARAVGQYVAGLAGHDWFEEELRSMTGIDVYAKPFEPGRGFATYEAGRFRVLVVRSEDLRRVGPAALAAHLGLADPVPILDRNLGEDHLAGDAYTLFKRTVRFPRPLVESAYDTRLARHFYDAAEIEGFIRRWSA